MKSTVTIIYFLIYIYLVNVVVYLKSQRWDVHEKFSILKFKQNYSRTKDTLYIMLFYKNAASTLCCSPIKQRLYNFKFVP